MRLIDADELPRHGKRGGIVHWKDIEEAPTIEPERPTGRWIIDRAFGADVLSAWQMVICSECGKGSYGKQNYCPNCGCRMEVEHDSN